MINPMIKLCNENNDEDESYALTRLSNVVIFFNEDDIISKIGTCDGNVYDTLISITNDEVDIDDLQCKSCDEFLVALDLHNCIHNVDMDAILQSCHENITKKQINLIKENVSLKRRLTNIKKLLKNIVDEKNEN